MTELLIRERELLDRLSFALLTGRDASSARRALLQFYEAINL